jgi:hypothetical protein
MTNIQKIFIASIKEIIRIAQYEALKEVNTHLISLFSVFCGKIRIGCVLGDVP